MVEAERRWRDQDDGVIASLHLAEEIDEPEVGRHPTHLHDHHGHDHVLRQTTSTFPDRRSRMSAP